MSTRQIDLNGLEYIAATVTADEVLDTQPVTLSFDGGTTWVASSWEGTAAATRTVRTNSVVNAATVFTTRGVYKLKARIVSGSESIVIPCGAIKVV